MGQGAGSGATSKTGPPIRVGASVTPCSAFRTERFWSHEAPLDRSKGSRKACWEGSTAQKTGEQNWLPPDPRRSHVYDGDISGRLLWGFKDLAQHLVCIQLFIHSPIVTERLVSIRHLAGQGDWKLSHLNSHPSRHSVSSEGRQTHTFKKYIWF